MLQVYINYFSLCLSDIRATILCWYWSRLSEWCHFSLWPKLALFYTSLWYTWIYFGMTSSLWLHLIFLSFRIRKKYILFIFYWVLPGPLWTAICIPVTFVLFCLPLFRWFTLPELLCQWKISWRVMIRGNVLRHFCRTTHVDPYTTHLSEIWLNIHYLHITQTARHNGLYEAECMTNINYAN